MAESVDIAEQQVLVLHGGDPTWHHRVLLLALPGGRWVCVTSTSKVQSDDLSVLTVWACGRRVGFPREC